VTCADILAISPGSPNAHGPPTRHSTTPPGSTTKPGVGDRTTTARAPSGDNRAVESKPSHWSAEIGAGFSDQGIADAYPHRPPYPQQAIQLLIDLVTGTPRTVLDVGCGTGDLARRLAEHVDRVDAVAASAAMLAKGHQLPGGDHPRLRWQLAAAEVAQLAPPYGLVTAGESLHWMDWPVVLSRFASALTPGGVLAVVERDWDAPPALAARLRPIFARYGSVREFRPMDVVDEIERRGLFTPVHRCQCGPEPWRPTVEEYVELRHSQRSFSRAHMDAGSASAFDAAIRCALDDLVQASEISRTDNRLDLTVEAWVVWGLPHADAR
jgi:SAM-dependent methyltransferase